MGPVMKPTWEIAHLTHKSRSRWLWNWIAVVSFGPRRFWALYDGCSWEFTQSTKPLLWRTLVFRYTGKKKIDFASLVYSHLWGTKKQAHSATLKCHWACPPILYKWMIWANFWKKVTELIMYITNTIYLVSCVRSNGWLRLKSPWLEFKSMVIRWPFSD